MKAKRGISYVDDPGRVSICTVVQTTLLSRLSKERKALLRQGEYSLEVECKELAPGCVLQKFEVSERSSMKRFFLMRQISQDRKARSYESLTQSDAAALQRVWASTAATQDHRA